MAKIKTKQTSANVMDFINKFANSEQKKKDSFDLINLMQEISGSEPKMWGPSIIGFGQYYYKSEKSKQEGYWPLIGFSPRKAAISLYVYSGNPKHAYLLNGLGKYKMGKACIYINKLTDINLDVLINLIRESVIITQTKYGKI
jgi:hypothetical protein